MNTTLISFVGRPPYKEKSSRDYTPTVYRFGGDASTDIAASFFGTALLRRLLAEQRSVRRWLLMGTHQSIWQTLLEIIPREEHDDLLAIYAQIADEVALDGHVKDETLAAWEAALNESSPVRIVCRIVGDGSTKESQETIWKAIDETVDNGDAIVVDITHGLRHQPIIASFMVMFLRWAKGVETIEMYYGAFELRKPDSDVCPVLELPICEELLAASEAVSTYRQTGDFVRLGDSLSLDHGELEKIAFANEMNRIDKTSASKTIKKLDEQEAHFGPIKRSLSPLFKNALHWNESPSLAEAYSRKADFAFEHGQYFQAIALLWEGLMVAGAGKLGIDGGTDFATRDRETKNEIKRNLERSEFRIFTKIEHLRNAIMHGTDPWPSPVEKDVRNALRDKNLFAAVFIDGRNLLQKLMK